jgi:hypothetical protein
MRAAAPLLGCRSPVTPVQDQQSRIWRRHLPFSPCVGIQSLETVVYTLRRKTDMKFISGLVLGMVLCTGLTLFAQNERAMHPRIATAIAALKDARAYMQAAPHDFGGHKQAAIRATDEAIRQLNFALAFRGRQDR